MPPLPETEATTPETQLFPPLLVPLKFAVALAPLPPPPENTTEGAEVKEPPEPEIEDT